MEEEDATDFIDKVQHFSPENEEHFHAEKSRSVKICLLSYKCFFIMCFCLLTCVQLMSTFFSRNPDNVDAIIQSFKKFLNKTGN